MRQSSSAAPEAGSGSTRKRVQAFQPKTPAAAPELELLALIPKQDDQSADTKKAKPRRRRFRLATWWPIGLGIFLAGFAPEWHLMASSLGIGCVRALFPLTLFASQSRLIGQNGTTADLLPQLALYLQFPLEGVLVKLTMDFGKTFSAGVALLFMLHGAAALVLWLT